MEKAHYPPYDTFQKTPTPVKTGSKKPREKNKCIHNTAYYLQILFSNIGICALLIGYTFLGSFIFLMIEGKSPGEAPARGLVGGGGRTSGRVNRTGSADWRQTTEEFRTRTVENIWEITAALNILYRENWTRLAGQEINRFQDELVQKLTEEILIASRGGAAEVQERQVQMEWNFSRAFLYSLTILTTIGYGGFSPKTFLGKIITIIYAVIGIPLMLLYLSSVGSVLSRCARGVCSRALCCCLCSNCGYCCYDEKRMQEKERRMKRKRELEELQQRQLQEPFYVRSSSSISGFTTPGNTVSTLTETKDLDDDWNIKSTGSILAPLGLCLMIMFTYIITGSILLIKLESWPFLDSCYFCFMSLSTINLTDVIILKNNIKNTTIWLCSMYILTGLALTAMCFNILHEELLKRLKKQLMSGITARREPGSGKKGPCPALAEEQHHQQQHQQQQQQPPGPDLYSTS